MQEIPQKKLQKLNNRCIIIAEAGVNHNGSIALAKQLIDVAAEAKADFVKFQTFKANKLVTNTANKASYQKITTSSDETQLQMLAKLELKEEDHYELIKYCSKKGISFLSTAFDFESIDLLKKLNIKLGKVPSGEITNLPYLRKMAKSFEQIILSTGMSDLDEIEQALTAIINAGLSKENITILHCNTEYPTPFKDVNLRAMNTIKDKLGVAIGYSDHTLGIEVPVAAVALGAKIIEKHFTLSRNMEGPDHKASLEPGELIQMIKSIRNIEEALGNSEKIASDSEQKNKVIARKSIVAAIDIKKGELFTEFNLTVKRPGGGINPMQWDNIVGGIAAKDFKADDLIEL
ncbi:MAG: N-acetylneuraminate synthase [Chitinophagaceae bacterium]|nr:N-acetylneuraminate synthase [Chitinophagaceae bacterium]